MASIATHIFYGDTPLPASWGRFFPEPLLLRKLCDARLPVVRFAVTSAALYRNFRRTGGVAPAVTEHLVEQFLTDNLSQRRKIVVRCPFVDANAPLPEPATVSLNATAILGVIESFYRAWQNEKFEHYRIARSVPESTAPILMLHSDCGATGVAFSRSPRTGEKTNESNRERGLVGAISRLAPETSLALRVSETLLRYPVELTVTNVSRKKTLAISGVQRLELTEECSLRALIDMLQDGELTVAEFLSQINVNWFRGATTFRVRPPSFQATGVPACAGVAFAPAYLRPPPNSQVPHGGIFVVAEVSPEDLPMIVASQAVVSTRGGISGHAALTCRSLGKPCVSGVGALEIDYTTRTIRSDAGVAHEGTLCMMNGTTGEVALLVGGGDTVFAVDTIATNTTEYLRTLRRLFGRMSVRQVRRFAGRKAELLSEIQSLFDLLDEP